MSWFSKTVAFLAGNSETTRDIFDRKNGHLCTFGEWIGNLKFTAEEMAELDAETAAGIRKFAIDTLNENTDRSKTRRDLAIFILHFYALLLFISGIVYPFNAEWSRFWFQLATGTDVGWLVLGVGAFFWGSHTLRTIKK